MPRRRTFSSTHATVGSARSLHAGRSPPVRRWTLSLPRSLRFPRSNERCPLSPRGKRCSNRVPPRPAGRYDQKDNSTQVDPDRAFHEILSTGDATVTRAENNPTAPTGARIAGPPIWTLPRCREEAQASPGCPTPAKAIRHASRPYKALADAKEQSWRWKVEWIKRWDNRHSLTHGELLAIKHSLAKGHPLACGFRRPKAMKGHEILDVPLSNKLFCEAPKSGFVELSFTVREAGRYRLRVLATAAPGFGRIPMMLDGRPLPSEFEFYCSRVPPAGSLELGTHHLISGSHRLRCTAVGKNRASTNYSNVRPPVASASLNMPCRRYAPNSTPP